jgi:hypothetical protein
MSRRRKIAKDDETQVLTRSRRRCCICFVLDHDSSEKEGQIAHLDRNPTNNALDNLAFLCLKHHDRYDSTTSQSKRMTMPEVKEYRAALYRQFEANPERDKSRPSTPPNESITAGRRDSLLKQLSQRIDEGERIRRAIRIERGALLPGRTYGPFGREDSRAPDREIVEFERFVQWKTRSATLLCSFITSDHPVHGELPQQFNRLKCGAGELRWGIAKLNAIRDALLDGGLLTG